jgi:hydroxymethylbilane synthase
MMTAANPPIRIATRGSALALAQAHMVMARCQAAFPALEFQLKVIKTTGDKLQTAALAHEGRNLPKGLFTKELEVALLNHEADLAVHSLKDLPTELPTGLRLGAVTERADVRDVLLYRDAQAAGAEGRGGGFRAPVRIKDLPAGTVVATSSTRRKAQLLAINPGLKTPDIRGNVLTRMQKLASQRSLDATILAFAGMSRLRYAVSPAGAIEGQDVPAGLRATILELDEMLPCVGQGAIGLEIRDNDEPLAAICQQLNHEPTAQCVTAERAFLAAMGGGCQSPVAAYAWVAGETLEISAVSFAAQPVRRARASRPRNQAVELGQWVAAQLKK